METGKRVILVSDELFLFVEIALYVLLIVTGFLIYDYSLLVSDVNHKKFALCFGALGFCGLIIVVHECINRGRYD